MHQLQLRAAVQTKQTNGLFLLIFQDHPNGVRTDGSKLQTLLDGLSYGREGMTFQQAENLDEFPCAWSVEFRFQAATEDPEADRQVPVLQRTGVVETSRFPLQDRQIMHGIKEELFPPPVASVASNQAIVAHKTDFIDRSDNCDRTICILRGDGVAVVVESHQRERTRFGLCETPSFEGLFRQRTQKLALLLGQQVFLRSRFASQLTVQILSAPLFQLAIQCLQRIDVGEGDQEVPTREIQESFHMPFLVGTAGRGRSDPRRESDS